MNALIGRAIECSIGEPWDFESVAGRNLLIGPVLATADAKSVGSEAVLCKVSTFQVAGHPVNMVQATKRHAIPGDLIEQLLAGEEVSCNLSYQYHWLDLGKPEFLDTRKAIPSGGWLIGSIRLS
jgi:hypothetical protein